MCMACSQVEEELEGEATGGGPYASEPLRAFTSSAPNARLTRSSSHKRPAAAAPPHPPHPHPHPHQHPPSQPPLPSHAGGAGAPPPPRAFLATPPPVRDRAAAGQEEEGAGPAVVGVGVGISAPEVLTLPVGPALRVAKARAGVVTEEVPIIPYRVSLR